MDALPPSSAPADALHPCLRCGACCAMYRVSFYWGELQSVGGRVPDVLVEPVSPFHVAMRGTARGTRPRCHALLGSVGEGVRCSVYELRPSPCREVRPSWEDGAPDSRCDRAREAHGLTPLRPEDWPAPQDLPGHPQAS